MSDEKQANDLNDINDEGEIFTLSDLLDQQREIDEVSLPCIQTKYVFEMSSASWIKLILLYFK